MKKTAVLVWTVVGLAMTALGWYTGLLDFFLPASNFAVSDFEASALPRIPDQGPVTTNEYTIRYVVTKNRQMSLRDCAAKVTHSTGDTGGRYESNRFDLTSTDEKIGKTFAFLAASELEGEQGTFRVICSGGFQTDPKSFRFPVAET
jgi:hypothetical protein